jgi:hypothetical protein
MALGRRVWMQTVESPALEEQPAGLHQPAGGGQGLDLVVPEPEQQARLRDCADPPLRFLEQCQGPHQLAIRAIDIRQADQRQDGALVFSVLHESLESLAQEALRFVQPALAPAEPGLQIEDQGALQGVPGADPQVVVGAVEGLAGPSKIRTQAPRLGDAGPGACPQVLQERLSVIREIEPVGQLDGQPGEPLAFGLARRQGRLASLQQLLQHPPGMEAGVVVQHQRLLLRRVPRQLGEPGAGLGALPVERDLPLAQLHGAALQGPAVVRLGTRKLQQPAFLAGSAERGEEGLEEVSQNAWVLHVDVELPRQMNSSSSISCRWSLETGQKIPTWSNSC